MWQVVIEFYALENNFFDERSIQTCSPFSCCSLASFLFKLDKFIFIITIDQAAGCNKIQLMCKWQLHAFLQNFKVTTHMSHGNASVSFMALNTNQWSWSVTHGPWIMVFESSSHFDEVAVFICSHWKHVFQYSGPIK